MAEKGADDKRVPLENKKEEPSITVSSKDEPSSKYPVKNSRRGRSHGHRGTGSRRMNQTPHHHQGGGYDGHYYGGHQYGGSDAHYYGDYSGVHYYGGYDSYYYGDYYRQEDERRRYYVYTPSNTQWVGGHKEHRSKSGQKRGSHDTRKRGNDSVVIHKEQHSETNSVFIDEPREKNDDTPKPTLQKQNDKSQPPPGVVAPSIDAIIIKQNKKKTTADEIDNKDKKKDGIGRRSRGGEDLSGRRSRGGEDGGGRRSRGGEERGGRSRGGEDRGGRSRGRGGRRKNDGGDVEGGEDRKRKGDDGGSREESSGRGSGKKDSSGIREERRDDVNGDNRQRGNDTKKDVGNREEDGGSETKDNGITERVDNRGGERGNDRKKVGGDGTSSGSGSGGRGDSGGSKWRSDGGKKKKKVMSMSSSSLTVQSNVLAQELTEGTYECMVCCEKIKSRHDVWGCSCCYNLFHLRCIGKWARSPAAAVNEENHEEGWRCPGCRNPLKVVPSVYKCFCGRVVNPNERRGRGDLTVPHSCGEPCLRKLATSEEDPCHHKCHQLCHPGPCPPCPVTVLRHCPCGKTISRVRCSQYKTSLPSCEEVCGKPLDCTLHLCSQTCHEGPCQPCEIEVEVSCFCKREKKLLKCGELLAKEGGASRNSYHCKRTCHRALSCGNHTCEEVCHEGECPPCALLPSFVTHCPCGATPISDLLPKGTERTSCLDDIPTCEKQCLKPHPCGTKDNVHLCADKCHIGDCPPCTSMSEVVCKCGLSTKNVPCQEAEEKAGFDCIRPCRKPMSCGRHKCQTKCCVAEDHECRRVCGRKFSCGVHTCPDICHPGGCGRCWNISYEELTCHCGGEVLLPPIHCGTEPPECTRPCARPHPCDHPVTHTCHNEEVCPQCTFLTERLCMGEHTVRKSIPCYLKDVSCGKPCGKPLPCGMHTCRKTCHKGPCFKEGEESCRQPCTRVRRYCTHSCSAPCHLDTPCPDTPCNVKVTLKCRCGYRSEKTLCLSSSAEVMSLAFQKLHQNNLGTLLRELQSGQSITINSVSLENLKQRQLDCTEECAQYERNRKLAEALELSDVDYSPEVGPPQYSSYLMEQVKLNRDFVESLEAIFKQLVNEAHQSANQSSTAKHTFKPMKTNNRRIVHELASHYNITTLSYDSEPLRNVTVTATIKSIVPSVTLSRHSDLIESAGRAKMMPPPVFTMKLPPPTGAPVITAGNKLLPAELETQPASNKTLPDYFNDDNL